MKAYLFYICLPLLATALIACEGTNGRIKVQNNIHGAVIRDVRWGDSFIEEQLLPGETSRSVVVYDSEDDNYGVNLPAAYPIKFYMEVQGDKLYLQTRASYNLDVEESVEVVLADSTAVFNPVLEAN